MASPISANGSIDVQGMVGALMKAERRPLEQMRTEAKRIDAKISAYGKLQSQIASFRDAAAALAKAETWQAVKATSSLPAAVEVVARAGASPSRHAIEVQQLAQAQTLASGRFAGTDAVVGGGTLRIQLGTQPTGDSSFEPDPDRTETSVTIPTGATLATVRDAINASGSGVRASIVRDGDQVRLFLAGAATGADQAFRIRTDDADGTSTDATGLSALAFDPTAVAGDGRNLSSVRPATDARYTIDGLALTARTNRVTDALDGVDLVLRQVTTAPVELDVAVDAAALEASTKTFVDAYNALNKVLAEQTRYDEAARAAGPLQGERSALTVLGQVRAIVRETVAGGTLARLSDVGITLQRDGSLAMRGESFQAAAGAPRSLQALFAGTGTGTDERGLMLRFRDLGDRLTGSEGPVSTATEAWRARKTANGRRQDALEVRMSDVEKRLLRQYTALDAQLAAAQSSSAALANALSALPKP
jgi:flagellar hook-associated protein 2